MSAVQDNQQQGPSNPRQMPEPLDDEQLEMPRRASQVGRASSISSRPDTPARLRGQRLAGTHELDKAQRFGKRHAAEPDAALSRSGQQNSHQGQISDSLEREGHRPHEYTRMEEQLEELDKEIEETKAQRHDRGSLLSTFSVAEKPTEKSSPKKDEPKVRSVPSEKSTEKIKEDLSRSISRLDNKDIKKEQVMVACARSLAPSSLTKIEAELETLYAENAASAQEFKGKQFPIVDGKWFLGCVNVLVGLNTIQMGAEIEIPEWEGFWTITENVFTGAFLVEAVIKLYILRKEFFRAWPNWLDLCLVILGVVDCWILKLFLAGDGGEGVDLQSLSILRILRLFRLVRVMRLVKNVKKLVLVVSGVVQAVQTTFWVSGLLLLVIYVCAIFCTDRLGRGDAVQVYPGMSIEEGIIDDQEVMANYNPHLAFGTLWRSMITLFNIAIMAEWTEIITPIMIKQPPFLLFFIFFALLVTFGVMNVIIGMIVDNVINDSKELDKEEQDEERRKQKTLLAQLHKNIKDIDKDGDGKVTLTELRESMCGDKKILDMDKGGRFPIGWEPEDLLSMLDDDGDGVLSQDEFIMSYFRMVDASPFHHVCIMQAGINDIKFKIRAAFNHTVELLDEGTDMAQGVSDRLEEFIEVYQNDIAQLNEKIDKILGKGNAGEALRSHADSVKEACTSADGNPVKEEKETLLEKSGHALLHALHLDHTEEQKAKSNVAVPEVKTDDTLSQKVLEILDSAHRSVRKALLTELGCHSSPEYHKHVSWGERESIQSEKALTKEMSPEPKPITAVQHEVGQQATQTNSEWTVQKTRQLNVAPMAESQEYHPSHTSNVGVAVVQPFNNPMWSQSLDSWVALPEKAPLLATSQENSQRPGKQESEGNLTFELGRQPLQHVREAALEDPSAARSAVFQSTGDFGHDRSRPDDEAMQNDKSGSPEVWKPETCTELLLFCFEQDTKLGFEVLWSTETPPQVRTVHDGQSAHQKGVRSGDRLVACNGNQIAGKGRDEILQWLKTRPLQLQLERIVSDSF